MSGADGGNIFYSTAVLLHSQVWFEGIFAVDAWTSPVEGGKQFASQ